MSTQSENYVLANKTREFCLACRRGDFEKVKMLIEKGVDINAPSPEWPNYTPLMYAVVGGNGEPPLENGNIDVIAFLIYSGADLNGKNGGGRTVFQINEFVQTTKNYEAFRHVKQFLNIMKNNAPILALFKMLDHKFIYLDIGNAIELVESLEAESLPPKGGKKRKTIRRRRKTRKSKTRRL